MMSETAHSEEGPLFGRRLRLEQFGHHDPNVLRLNNGSFGACPRDVLQAQRALQDEWNSNPDDFWHLLPRRFAETSAALASRLLHARAEDVFVVENLTVGMAALAHSLIANITQPGSIVLMSNHTYNAVQLAVKHCCSLASSRMGHSVDILMVDLPFPVLSADHDNIFLDRYAAALDSVPSGKVVRYAFLDHITSVPSMKMPVQRLVKLLRDRGVLEVIVDAAHSPGMANVADVINADGGTAPDYYLSNLHKWCMSPMAAAFLWVSPTAPSRASLHHPIISHCCGEGFKSECAMLGSRDYSSMLAIPAALDFIDLHLGGIDAMCKRNASLCYDAALMLSAAWGTQHCMAPASLCTGCAMIGCPQLLGDTFEDGERLRLLLRSWKPPHSSELQVTEKSLLLPQPAEVTGGIVIQKLTAVKGDRLYIRLSAAVYNYMEEYHVLRDAVLDIVSKHYCKDQPEISY